MNGIKVKIDNPQPGHEEIKKYKNFDRFMDRYKKYYSFSGIREMLYNDRRKLIYIVLLVVFMLLLLFGSEEAEAGANIGGSTKEVAAWVVKCGIISPHPESLSYF